jgi:NADH:ubiquinone oxidoreductase subunit 4 (subunit M)
MQELSLFAAAFFLPLFPLGMVFNAIFQHSCNAWLRSALLIAWPLAGLGLLQLSQASVPEWFVLWALLSAILYGFRAVVVRELGVWSGFFATSAWALIWVALVAGPEPGSLVIHALAFSLPLVLLVFLSAELERRYETAYAGIVSGIAQAQPRLAGAITITLLAVIGSPLFPAFFALLNSITQVLAVSTAAAFGVAAVWLLWSWSGMQLLQQLLVGPASAPQREDIARGTTAAYSMSLLILLISGAWLSGTML